MTKRLIKVLGEHDIGWAQFFIQNPIKCIIGFILTVGAILLLADDTKRQ